MQNVIEKEIRACFAIAPETATVTGRKPGPKSTVLSKGKKETFN